MNKLGQKIYLVPDTGFQMFFFPLTIEGDTDDTRLKMMMGAASNEVDKLKAEIHRTIVANRTKVKWGQFIDKPDLKDLIQNFDEQSWERCAQGHRFVLHRMGPCDAHGMRFLGIWMAIETNLGEKDRGWFYQEIGNPDPSRYTSAVLEATPYAAASVNSLKRDDAVSVEYNQTRFDQPLQWQVPAADDIEVDLIIDFGNSRTCVLVLERRLERDSAIHGDKFAELCRPLPLRPSFYADVKDVSVDEGIVSSRFVLKTPEFRTMDFDASNATSNAASLVAFSGFTREEKSTFFWKKGKTVLDRVEVRIPHMFSKLSPVCLGDDMSDMIGGASFVAKQFRERVRQGQHMQQSSAKRFFWDERLLDVNEHGPWSMMPNFGDTAYGQNKFVQGGKGGATGQSFEPITLAGLLLRFQPATGEHWSLNDSPPMWGKSPGQDARPRSAPETRPSRPIYPRRNTLTWSILAIMEIAQRHINSVNWTTGAHANRRRRIRTVVGTYPSGWSGSELDAYRAKWQEALNIFTLTQLPKSAPPVSLEMNLDESVASQLPLLYSCIGNFANSKKGENWIQLNGVEGPGGLPVVRVMNLDIGGGTSDVSVVEYLDNEAGINVDLQATVKFRDSYSDAGDGLLKKVIEDILVNKLAGDGGSRGASLALFREVFAGEQIEKEGVSSKATGQHREQELSSQRIAWLISVLSPLAIKLLQARSEGRPLVVSPSEAGIQRQNWEDFRKRFEVSLGHEAKIQVTSDELDELVVKQFGLLINGLAKLVSAFDVHMLFVCGKPSEQPAIREMVQRLLPVPLERVHFASGFRSGQWYPFRRRTKLSDAATSSDANERIDDAKTVTCVGAALARAISARLIPGWKLKISKEQGLQNTWGEMISEPKNRPKGFQRKIEFTNQAETSNPVDLSPEPNRWIGRKMFDFDDQRPEPVYKLIWLGNVLARPDKVQVVFRRIPSTAESADALELVKVTDVATKADLSSKVKLQLYPVSTTPWLDTGKLFDK
jgi:hypothetical protein